MDVKQAILTKRAVRQFSEQPLSPEDMQAILDAGRRAQSSKNSQPWHFIAIRDAERLKQTAALGRFGSPLERATFAVLILTPDPAQRWSIMFDAGQAAAYMQLAAWERGIGSVPIAIYEPEKGRELFGFPDEYYLNAALAFGYPADPKTLSRPPHGQDGRKARDEIFHWEQW